MQLKTPPFPTWGLWIGVALVVAALSPLGPAMGFFGGLAFGLALAPAMILVGAFGGSSQFANGQLVIDGAIVLAVAVSVWLLLRAFYARKPVEAARRVNQGALAMFALAAFAIGMQRMQAAWP